MLVYESRKKPQKSSESGQKLNHSSSVSQGKFDDGSEKEREDKQNKTFTRDFDAHYFGENSFEAPIFVSARSPKKAT